MQTVQTLSKSQFASHCGVSPGRVTQWFSEGKLDADVLDGEGRSARIRVDIALAQLKKRLDTSQRFGLNGLATNLAASETRAPPQSPPASPPPAPAARDTVEESIKAEKLRQAQLLTRRFEREDREQLGLYMRTDEARAEMARLANAIVEVFEGALPNFANALAARFEMQQRDILHVLRQEFTATRGRAAATIANQAAALPETVPDDEEPETH